MRCIIKNTVFFSNIQLICNFRSKIFGHFQIHELNRYDLHIYKCCVNICRIWIYFIFFKYFNHYYISKFDEKCSHIVYRIYHQSLCKQLLLFSCFLLVIFIGIDLWIDKKNNERSDNWLYARVHSNQTKCYLRESYLCSISYSTC